MPKRLIVVFVFAWATAGARAQPGPPQEPAPVKSVDAKTVWDGVYTDAQAERGKTGFDLSCRACHKDGPRKDDLFMRDWSGSGVESLFGQIKMSMPAGAPASLSDSEYLDVVSYILRVNAFPAGGRELSAETIKGIRIEGRNGPEPVPNFALVQAVGCLAQGPGASWVLVNASEPVRTKNPAVSVDEELTSSTRTTPGVQTFTLLNVYPAPDSLNGHKVEAKGFLIRDRGENRINVTSVQTLAPRCDKTN